MRIIAITASASVLALLAGCASPPPPAATPTAAAPAAAPPAASTQTAAGLDGVYRAPPGGVHGNSACGTTAFGYSIRVTNGVATMQTVMSGRLEGRVAPDGSLLIEEGAATLRGQFTPGEFNGSYTRAGRSNACTFTLNYKK